MTTTDIARVEDSIVRELLEVVNLDIAIEDDEVLIDALNRTFKESAVKLNINPYKIVKELKRKYFEKFREEFLRNLKEVRTERLQYIPEKQLMYLAATVFAELILNKPAPASLIFEILRCIGMEEDKNFPNRYYFLRELEKRGLVKSITLTDSKRVEKLYCPTNEGKKAVDGTAAFDMLIELQDKILQDQRVKSLIENYSKEEPDINVDLPKLLKTSQIISENEKGVKVFVYSKTRTFLSWEELKKIDEIAKNFGKITQMDIRNACGSQWKAGAYTTYAYHKGWIKIAEKKG